MNICSTLIAVTDMERSKKFYRDVLGLSVTEDLGANVTLGGRVSLQTADTWAAFIGGRGIAFGGNAFELYFEEDDIDGFISRLSGMAGIEYVHLPKEHSWGQRVVRLFDPDGHIVEVGENMDIVVKRFLDGGLSAEETALRMGVPASYVLERAERGR